MRKILIVEDEKEANHVIKAFLEAEDYEVYQAFDGKQGMNIFEKEAIDLVILDVMMPEMDGFQVLKEIRYCSKVPIIITTALLDDQTQLDAFMNQADDYVIKPYSIAILVERVNRMIHRVYGDRGGIITIEGLDIDLDACEVRYNNEVYALTKKEFSIIRFLLNNRGRIVERGQLIDHVWGYDALVDERSVDAHVKNLRKKLPISLIETVKGIGYMVVK